MEFGFEIDGLRIELAQTNSAFLRFAHFKFIF